MKQHDYDLYWKRDWGVFLLHAWTNTTDYSSIVTAPGNKSRSLVWWQNWNRRRHTYRMSINADKWLPSICYHTVSKNTRPDVRLRYKLILLKSSIHMKTASYLFRKFQKRTPQGVLVCNFTLDWLRTFHIWNLFTVEIRVQFQIHFAIYMSNLGYSLVLNSGKVSSIAQFQFVITRAGAWVRRGGLVKECSSLFFAVIWYRHWLYTRIQSVFWAWMLSFIINRLHSKPSGRLWSSLPGWCSLM